MHCDDPELDREIFRFFHKNFVEDVVERKKSEIPETFVPSAQLIALGHELLLFLANPMTMFRGRKPRRWLGSEESQLFRTVVPPYFLEVCHYGNLWSIERYDLDAMTREVLAFVDGPTPIFHRDHRQAMALAKDCHPKPREEAQCMNWVPMAA